jgi:hypothetical protein
MNNGALNSTRNGISISATPTDFDATAHITANQAMQPITNTTATVRHENGDLFLSRLGGSGAR